MIFGIALDRTNPEYTKSHLEFWMPKLKPFLETTDGETAFTTLYPIANAKIFYSIWGSDWQYAMSLCIAHYLTLIAKNSQSGSVGDDISSVASLDTYAGILASMQVGSFSKSYDLAKTMIDSDDAKWWNLTAAGAALMALYKTKAAPSIFVVSPTPCYPNNIATFDKRQSQDISVIFAEMNIKIAEQGQEINSLKSNRAISAVKSDD